MKKRNKDIFFFTFLILTGVFIFLIIHTYYNLLNYSNPPLTEEELHIAIIKAPYWYLSMISGVILIIGIIIFDIE